MMEKFSMKVYEKVILYQLSITFHGLLFFFSPHLQFVCFKTGFQFLFSAGYFTVITCNFHHVCLQISEFQLRVHSKIQSNQLHLSAGATIDKAVKTSAVLTSVQLRLQTPCIESAPEVQKRCTRKVKNTLTNKNFPYAFQ